MIKEDLKEILVWILEGLVILIILSLFLIFGLRQDLKELTKRTGALETWRNEASRPVEITVEKVWTREPKAYLSRDGRVLATEDRLFSEKGKGDKKK